MLQKGDILKTKKGSFPLEEVKAGECAGVSILTMQEEYTEFSSMLNELGISYSFNNGKLELQGKGNGKTLTGDLKVNYCETTEDIETKSLIWDWLF